MILWGKGFPRAGDGGPCWKWLRCRCWNKYDANVNTWDSVANLWTCIALLSITNILEFWQDTNFFCRYFIHILNDVHVIPACS